MSRRICLTIALAILFATSNVSIAAPPALNVQVGGLELLPQSLFGAALFIFEVQGEVDGRSRRGWGWVAANHTELGADVGDQSLITRGEGAIWIGLQRYDVAVTGGLLTLIDTKDENVFDDLFMIELEANISRRGQSAKHQFLGLLDHEPFPPTIVGDLGVVP